MRTIILAAVSSLALTACGMQGQDSDQGSETVASADNRTDYGYETYGDDNLADTMASNDDRHLNEIDQDAAGEKAQASETPDPEERPIMQAQVVLDRVGFAPGVIDGKMGMSTENALRGFQEANDLSITGKLDEATKNALSDWERIPATRLVTIPASWGDATYTDMPEDVAEKAKLQRLGYKSLDERLAERFHTTVDVLRTLNPDGRPAGASGSVSTDEAETAETTASGTSENQAYFVPGQQVRVPNIGGDWIAPGSVEDGDWQRTLASLGVGTEQPEVDRIVVSKAGKTLKAYRADKLVALFTVSSGSSEFPLPLGEWDILGEAYNPPYSYDPAVLGKDDPDGEAYTLPPGPNSPVGVVWIDLSKEHYGIHGTPDPETIGRAQSSGCVRLTNWDAARLAGMVSQSTQVIFEA
ncbi:L,D-transpeptidase family protein [Erythrobacter sp.]|uniref:L,D-transpeptidase family protein n=1 Tax=Erythrobacter sp. TaxID=1042 RepID=UPI0025B9C7E2|nr:L,D-transpeptidase family protein [Erythrobacter sp.]